MKLDPINDYVKNFSELQDLFEPDEEGKEPSAMVGFAKILQQKVKENKVKVDIKNAIFSKMKGIKNKRDLADGLITEEDLKK